MTGTETKIKMVAMWEGKPIDTLPYSKLVEIIEELVQQRDDARDLARGRSYNAVDYMRNSSREWYGTSDVPFGLVNPLDMRWTGLSVEHMYTFRTGIVGADKGRSLTIVWDADPTNNVISQVSAPFAHLKEEFKIFPKDRK